MGTYDETLKQTIEGYHPKDVYNYVLKNILTDEFIPNTPNKIASYVLESFYQLPYAGIGVESALRKKCIEPLLKDRPQFVEKKGYTFAKYYCGRYEALTEEELQDIEAYAKEDESDISYIRLYIGSRGTTLAHIQECDPTIAEKAKQLSKYFEEKYKSPLYVVNSYRRAPGWEEYLAKLE